MNARLHHKSQISNERKIKSNWKQMASETGARANLDLAEAFTIVNID